MKFTYDYERAVNASTVAVLTSDLKKILIGKRGDDSDAYPGAWCLPGGILEVGTERMITVARRETKEECGIDIEENRWTLFYVDDKPNCDPRFRHVINLCYYAIVSNEEYNEAVAGDDLAEITWVTVEEALTTDLAFDHNVVLKELLDHLYEKIEDMPKEETELN